MSPQQARRQGKTQSQRGWSRFSANTVTLNPGAAVGVRPAGHPFAGAMLTVGKSVRCGGGNLGYGPIPAEKGSVACSLQAQTTETHSSNTANARASRLLRLPAHNRRDRTSDERMVVVGLSDPGDKLGQSRTIPSHRSTSSSVAQHFQHPSKAHNAARTGSLTPLTFDASI